MNYDYYTPIYYTTPATTTSNVTIQFSNGNYILYDTQDIKHEPEPEPVPCTEDELTDFIIGKRGAEPT